MEKPNGKLIFYGDEVPLVFPPLYSNFIPLVREILGLDENFLSNVKLSYRDSDDDKIEIKNEEDYKLFIEEINKGKQMLMTVEVKEDSSLDIKSCSSSILNYVEKKSGNINNFTEEVKKNSVELSEEINNNKNNNIKLDLNENIDNDFNNDENSNKLIMNNNIEINNNNKKEENKSENIKNLDEQINNNNNNININMNNKLNENNINQIPQKNNININNNINNPNQNQNIPQMSQNQNNININNNNNNNINNININNKNSNASQLNINKLTNKYLYMISFPYACSLCKVGPLYRVMYFCKDCNLIICSRCEQVEGERHYHPLYKVQNGSQFQNLNINGVTTLDKFMDSMEGAYNKAYNSVLGFFGAGQNNDNNNNNNNSRVQQQQKQQQVPQLVSVVQLARNIYDLRNVSDQQIEEALIKSKGNIDQAVFSLVPSK